MNPRQGHAIREKHLDVCRSKAIAMRSLPLGQQATEGGFYTQARRTSCAELGDLHQRGVDRFPALIPPPTPSCARHDRR